MMANCMLSSNQKGQHFVYDSSTNGMYEPYAYNNCYGTNIQTIYVQLYMEKM